MKVDDVTELPQHQAAAATRLQACRSLISRTPRNEQQLLASQRVLSFFAGSFLSTALSSIDSADGFFSLQFSSSSSPTAGSDTSMPRYLASSCTALLPRWRVCALSRLYAAPASCSRRTYLLFVNLTRFIVRPSSKAGLNAPWKKNSLVAHWPIQVPGGMPRQATIVPCGTEPSPAYTFRVAPRADRQHFIGFPTVFRPIRGASQNARRPYARKRKPARIRLYFPGVFG